MKARAKMKLVVGISGASGAIYGKRLVEELLRQKKECHLVVSEAGKAVIAHELGEDCAAWPSSLQGAEALHLWKPDDLFAPFCSGSNTPDAMVVAPCSMGTLGRIAAGTSDSLLIRAADVCLKERIPLVLAVRETPLNLIHIENMARVTRAGAVVLPAAPGFYHRPRDMDDLINHLVGKILDTLGVRHHLFQRWNESAEE
jgi:4-hydroxy-3-polyprenylbenzoate decarboxylase